MIKVFLYLTVNPSEVWRGFELSLSINHLKVAFGRAPAALHLMIIKTILSKLESG